MGKQNKRIGVDPSKLPLKLDGEELRELLGIPADAWAEMPDSGKLLLLAKRGIRLTQEALERDQAQDG